MINETHYSGGQINSLKSQFFRLPVKYNEQKRNLPCSMVEREKLRDHDPKKIREVLSEYLRILFKSILLIHFGFRFLTPTIMNDKTNIGVII
ncbi:hypothetical protein SAMN05660841_04370 [Sphingobacterium nematocida]|uniref:Uncharacterized protein n=1 Tax=Sphingobacterium nematocida TaxID=1513896 RepID=A0A1T5GUV2_9SPHI|nr:hypothetical protein SAMN05660841_04370 [Sphingobacterium nematocida]